MRKILWPLALLIGTAGIAQEKTLDHVLRSRTSATGYIRKHDELAGYYSFYKVDKVDSKTSAYRMALLDANLNDAGEINLNRPSNSMLLESEFNGSTFMFLFITDKSVEFETYDASGKKMGEKVYEDVNMWERNRLALAAQGGDDASVSQSIWPIGEEGFLKLGAVKEKGEKRSYQLTGYNNDLSVRWETTTPKSGLVENIGVLSVTKDHVVGYLLKQKNAMDVPETSFMTLFDVHTGKQLWEKELTHQGKRLSLLNVFPTDDGEAFFAIGEFFGPNDNIFKDKSTGLFAMRMGLDGIPTQVEFYEWEKDILPHVPADEKGKKEMKRIVFHSAVRLSNGYVHCIGEEFKKTLSPGGGIQVVSQDMFIFKLDPDGKLVGCDVVPKSKTRLELGGMIYTSTAMLGTMLKQWGFFDYEFTTKSKDGMRYFATYVDFDKTKNESGKKVGTCIGTIVGTGPEPVTVDKYPIDMEEATSCRVYPGKPGYVLIHEYFKKQKKARFRLEKVNY